MKTSICMRNFNTFSGNIHKHGLTQGKHDFFLPFEKLSNKDQIIIRIDTKGQYYQDVFFFEPSPYSVKISNTVYGRFKILVKGIKVLWLYCIFLLIILFIYLVDTR
jgi:hypothetical protein